MVGAIGIFLLVMIVVELLKNRWTDNKKSANIPLDYLLGTAPDNDDATENDTTNEMKSPFYSRSPRYCKPPAPKYYSIDVPPPIIVNRNPPKKQLRIITPPANKKPFQSASKSHPKPPYTELDRNIFFLMDSNSTFHKSNISNTLDKMDTSQKKTNQTDRPYLKRIKKIPRPPFNSTKKSKGQKAEHQVLLSKIISNLAEENVELIPRLSVGSSRKQTDKIDLMDVLGEIVIDLGDEDIRSPLIFKGRDGQKISGKLTAYSRKRASKARMNHLFRLLESPPDSGSDSRDIPELIPIATVVRSKRKIDENNSSRTDRLVEEINDITRKVLGSSCLLITSDNDEAVQLLMNPETEEVADEEIIVNQKERLKEKEDLSDKSTIMKDQRDPDHYTLLGIDPCATKEEIVKAYEKRKYQYRPERLKSLNKDLQEIARKRFDKIQTAYKILSDESSRVKYDEEIRVVKNN